MPYLKPLLTAAVVTFSSLTNIAVAEERQPMDYINAAKEYLPYSCKKLALYVEEDEAEMAEAVGYLIAVSVINRGIDLEKIMQSPEEMQQFESDISEEIKSSCESDVDTLMASAVDQAIVKLLSE